MPGFHLILSMRFCLKINPKSCFGLFGRIFLKIHRTSMAWPPRAGCKNNLKKSSRYIKRKKIKIFSVRNILSIFCCCSALPTYTNSRLQFLDLLLW